MRPLSAVVALATFAPACIASQESTPRTVPSGAHATAFAPERLDRIDTVVNRLVTEGKIPGAVVMLVRDGKVAYHKAFGFRDLQTREPQAISDIFRIASQTKAITSLAAMMLWEEGRFMLDEPVGKYIPAFRDQTVLTKFNQSDSTYEAKPARRRTTIRQLFTHTSGLDYADIGSDEFKAIYSKAGVTAMGRDGEVLADRISALGRLPLRAEPGERFIYSLSSDVLGRLVEVVSGMPLDQFFRTRIFEPLGMRDTWFALPADRRNRLVALHQETDGKLVATHDGFADFPARPVTYFSGGAGLSSTTADYARFLQLFLNGGELDGVRLLGRKTVELMLSNHVKDMQPAFGLGFALETPSNDFESPVSVGSFSWGGAFKTSYWADPRERLVGLIFTNMFGSSLALAEQFQVLVYSALR